MKAERTISPNAWSVTDGRTITSVWISRRSTFAEQHRLVVVGRREVLVLDVDELARLADRGLHRVAAIVRSPCGAKCERAAGLAGLEVGAADLHDVAPRRAELIAAAGS